MFWGEAPEAIGSYALNRKEETVDTATSVSGSEGLGMGMGLIKMGIWNIGITSDLSGWQLFFWEGHT